MKIEIEKSRTTPYVLFDQKNGEIKFEGRSSPHNALEFYNPILEALRSDSIDSTEITLDFMMEYFNTSSTKCLFLIFKQIGGLVGKGHSVTVNWHAEEDDYDLIETGEDFEELSNVSFNYVLT